MGQGWPDYQAIGVALVILSKRAAARLFSITKLRYQAMRVSMCGVHLAHVVDGQAFLAATAGHLNEALDAGHQAFAQGHAVDAGGGAGLGEPLDGLVVLIHVGADDLHLVEERGLLAELIESEVDVAGEVGVGSSGTEDSAHVLADDQPLLGRGNVHSVDQLVKLGAGEGAGGGVVADVLAGTSGDQVLQARGVAATVLGLVALDEITLQAQAQGADVHVELLPVSPHPVHVDRGAVRFHVLAVDLEHLSFLGDAAEAVIVCLVQGTRGDGGKLALQSVGIGAVVNTGKGDDGVEWGQVDAGPDGQLLFGGALAGAELKLLPKGKGCHLIRWVGDEWRDTADAHPWCIGNTARNRSVALWLTQEGIRWSIGPTQASRQTERAGLQASRLPGPP